MYTLNLLNVVKIQISLMYFYFTISFASILFIFSYVKELFLYKIFAFKMKPT